MERVHSWKINSGELFVTTVRSTTPMVVRMFPWSFTSGNDDMMTKDRSDPLMVARVLVLTIRLTSAVQVCGLICAISEIQLIIYVSEHRPFLFE